LEFQYNGTTLGSQDVGLSNRGPEFEVYFDGERELEIIFPRETQLSLNLEKVSLTESSHIENNIEGVWKSEGIVDETSVLKEEILFFEGQFIFIQRDLTGLPVGVESGRYEVRGDGKLDMVLEFDGL
jgi:hypothetical protein